MSCIYIDKFTSQETKLLLLYNNKKNTHLNDIYTLNNYCYIT